MSDTILQQFQGPVTGVLHGSRIHHWPSPSAKPTATLLFIPGNPGLSDYYIQYLTSLHRAVNADGSATALEIFCPSQLGHDPLSPESDLSMVSLDEQVKHKALILGTISSRWSDHQPKIILSGHSIGAYMALEIVRRSLHTAPVTSIHLLFPTLSQMLLTPNAKKLSWLFRISDRRQHQSGHLLMLLILALLATLLTVSLKILQVLPLPIVHFFVLIGAPTQPPSAVKTTTNFIMTPSCVQQALYLASDEMQLVRQLDDLARSTSSGTTPDVKIRAYWAAGDQDGWAPEKTRKVVERTLGLHPFYLPQAMIAESGRKTHKPKSYSIDDIRKARQSKRRAFAGMVRAGASASYGLASSVRQLGSRQQEASTSFKSQGQAPSSSRSSRRRPSLMSARASRRFDGTIYIEPEEPAEGEMAIDDILANNDGGLNDIDLQNVPGNDAREGSNGKKVTLSMPPRASIVCRQGFKHAFVLESSEQMASMSAAMILADLA
ncbi:hypothetical protein CBS101457_000050 [Exobasidium rhododendri]|nr:hypothetical protein CBS101457_000050 [Exobasidium rhododendri]